MNIKYLSLGLGLAVCLSFIPVMAQNNSFNDNIMEESARQALAKSKLKDKFKNCITTSISGLEEIINMKGNWKSVKLIVESLETICHDCGHIWLFLDYFPGEARVCRALRANKIDTITNDQDIISFIVFAFRNEYWTGVPVSEYILLKANWYLSALIRFNELIEQW